MATSVLEDQAALLERQGRLAVDQAVDRHADEVVAPAGPKAGVIIATQQFLDVRARGEQRRVDGDVLGELSQPSRDERDRRAEALVDVRPFPGEEDAALARVRELVGPDIEIEMVHHDIGLEEPFEGDLVDRMIGALHRHDPGAPVLPYLMSGGTDNKALAKLGITGYGFAPLRLGPGLDFPAMFHGVDERVPLDALAFGRAVLGDFLRDC